MKTILCYGDSNTWGFVPGSGERYPSQVRWPGVLQSSLGDGFRVIEEGLNGRTTVWEDAILPGRNGAQYLAPCLESHRPLDLVILALGTNDLKKRFSASAEDIARGVGILIGIVARSAAGLNGRAPAVLVLAPPPLGRLSNYAETFDGADGKPARITAFLKQITADARGEFLDVGEYAAVSDIDGVHFDAEGHARLARAVADRIRQMPVWNSPPA
jgi:lysophospholipase L1-like esterase